MKKTTYLTLSIITIATLLSGCGDTSSDNPSTSAVTGQLVDNYLENVDYLCGDGTTGITDANGSFSCSSLPVEFKLHGLKLGIINQLNNDKQVFPQDLVGVLRTDFNNTDVVAMARFLQSCDDDNDVKNGIRISDAIKNSLTADIDFNSADISAYAADANITLIDENTTTQHLTDTTQLVESIYNVQRLPLTLQNALLTPSSTLTQDIKNTLAYMGNEERLAYDVYNYLYNHHLQTNVDIKQLTNIATKSEAVHIQTVQLLVQKYITSPSDFTNVSLTDLDLMYADVSSMPAGVYDIAEIQTLYNELIIKGSQSQQDALEVGCMIEVVDINDLAADITIAKDSNASDVVTAFEFLRDGSYKHYWAFDKGLKNMGITDGCCSFDNNYCHPEYPTN